MSSGEQVRPGPGWYPYENHQRYWDGTTWTPHTAGLEGIPGAGGAPTPTPHGPVQAIGCVLRRYARFRGRATRTEFWWWWLAHNLAIVLLVLFGRTDPVTGEPSEQSTAFLLLFILATLLPSLAVIARRLHDTDRSSFWILVQVVPLAGVIVLLIFLTRRSDPQANRHGPAPGVRW